MLDNFAAREDPMLASVSSYQVYLGEVEQETTVIPLDVVPVLAAEIWEALLGS